MLVHMTPGEVKGLQSLAMAHGGSLTVNPHTGLPEAGFLKNILPTLVGVGLGFMGVPTWAAGLGAGAFETIRTGNLGRGLLAGLGAFGGAGLGSALSSMGAQAASTNAIGQEIAAQTAQDQAKQRAMERFATTGAFDAGVGLDALQGGLGQSLPNQVFGSEAGMAAINQASTTGANQFANQGIFDQLKGGYNAMINDPRGMASTTMEKLGGTTGTMLAAAPTATSVLSAMTPKTEFPQVAGEKSTYAGPYVPMERSVRFKPDEDTSTSEFTYFSPSNPVPGFRPYTAADGGSVPDPDGDSAGLTALARGGRYLQGPGDGTSDSIPATIAGRQPARLADGEFVVDARTVSEIGNGSSNAGAKKLYAMMNRVHAARRNAKRGQDSNAEKYLPA